MAAYTWHGFYYQVNVSVSNYCAFDIFNQATSIKTIKIYRAFVYNSSSSLSGTLSFLSLNRLSGASGGLEITPVPHDSAASALDAYTSLGYGRTVTTSSTFRRMLYSQDEPNFNTASEPWDSLLTCTPYAEVWNSGYHDNVIEPVACRSGENEGFGGIFSAGAAQAFVDCELEFTSE